MAILHSNGIIIVDAIPVHTPVDEQAILAWDKVGTVLYYFSGGTWQTAGWSLADGDLGDIVVSGAGTVFTIDNGVVTFAKMQDISTDTLLGRDTAGSGDVEEISVGGGIEFTGIGGIQRAALTSDVTAPAGSNVTTISNNVVSNAKLADMATDSLIGRDKIG